MDWPTQEKTRSLAARLGVDQCDQGVHLTHTPPHRLADFLAHVVRQPILLRPDNVGMGGAVRKRSHCVVARPASETQEAPAERNQAMKRSTSDREAVPDRFELISVVGTS